MTPDTPRGGEPQDPGGAFRDKVLAITFTAEAGKQMLESSTSVSEVLVRLRGFLPSVGLEGCSVDALMSSLTLSYWQPGQAMPLTTMRELNVSSPRLEILSGTHALLERVERHETGLGDAFYQLRAIVRAPARSAWMTRLARPEPNAESVSVEVGRRHRMDGMQILRLWMPSRVGMPRRGPGRGIYTPLGDDPKNFGGTLAHIGSPESKLVALTGRPGADPGCPVHRMTAERARPTPRR